MHVRILLARYRTYRPCPDCGGRRYQTQTGYWRMAGKTLAEINALPFSELASFFEKIKTRDESALMPLENIRKRLRFLLGVGLGYLTLDRATRTLSGGELQRVNLTGCLGTGLTGTLFVLDEPSIGLHPRDTGRLLGLLHELRQSGNTVLVVEHDESVIRAAESILELGPGSGAAGGNLLYSGPPAGLLKVKDSPTGAFLAGRKSVPLPPTRRPCPEQNHPWLRIRGATRHNLKNLNFSFPLHRLVAVSGVSGSGKSTLVHEIVHQALLQHLGRPIEESPQIKSLEGAGEISDVVLVDQSPLSQTPRSTPLLYLDIYDAVRELFASTEEAQSAGLAASAFSFNAGGGRCERCGGMGYEKVTMQFLSDVFVSCPSCEGRRFQPHVLAAPYLGKTIDQLLEMTAAEALNFFSLAEDLTPRARECHQKICASLRLLGEVGLGYLRCGQPLSQLSGGEAQRLKLIAHLTAATAPPEKPRRGGRRKKTPHGSPLLILDEPTTGLHLEDVRVLVALLHRLVEQGHSLLVIEHHLDVLKNADWLLDLGPEAGQEGGRLVAAGTPETVATIRGSHTAAFLAPLLNPSRSAKVRELPAIDSQGHPGSSAMTVRGARHHNLKNLNVAIPRDRMVVVTGLSGSGKSTLAFDLLFSEGQRRYLDCLNTYARQFVEQMEKPDVDSITGLPPSVAIEQRTTRGGRKSTVATVTELYQFLRLLYAKLGVQHDPDTGEPAIRQTSADIIKRVRAQLRSAKNLSLLAPLIRGRKGFHTEVARWALKKGFSLLRVDGRWIEPAKFQPLDRYREHQIEVLVAQVHSRQKDLPTLVSRTLALGKGTLYAIDHRGKSTIHSHHLFCPGTNRSFDELEPRLFSFNSPHGWCPECQGYGTVFAEKPVPKAEDEAEKEQELELAREELGEDQLLPCPSCQGARLNPVARAVRFAGRPVPEISALSVRDFGNFFSKLRFSGREAAIVRDIRPEIEQRLHFLSHVGLDYLNLDRSAPTLSGGESQRIRLAAQLGSNLQGVLYVLDEPTIGLHPRDNEKLLGILKNLRDRGNSLVVVEHDEDTMRAADHILDLGPGAGVHGGEIVAQGTWKEIGENDASATARLIGSPIRHPSRGHRRPIKRSDPWVKIKGANIRTIRNLDLELPLHRLIAFSGVSGSGKSTLLHEILLPAAGKKTKKKGLWKSVSGVDSIDRVVEVDQSPIGKTPRSTVATYLGLMDELRSLYAALPEARQAGFTTSHFSHNAGPGRCPACDGAGTVRIQMNFLPPADVRCEECNGHRWKPEILSIRYREKSIHDALHLSAEQAAEFFSAQPRLATPCRLLTETGLGYLELGQTSPTLSGGEAQRLKLVTELAAAQISADQAQAKGRARRPAHHLFLLEEPTVGLHLADVRRLIDLLHRLVDTGHTVVVIEHHLDVLAEADYLVDLGPESGGAGGKIVAQGTPEDVATSKISRTAPFLRSHLSRSSGL
jgi:excinuclease ABC subunit A